jgi:dTDP-4-dehydrorhamnose reductase
MRILITGGLGQLGTALQCVLDDHELTIVDLPDVDISDRQSILEAILDSQPQAVIHCAAYTDVDGCARNPELAYQVNATGTQNVALASKAAGAELIHISTNEVFAGDWPGGYEEWQQPRPINAYGHSKTWAEFYVRTTHQQAYIVRTAWLYAPGGRNFIHAILRRARETGELRVVADEIGNPTYINDLAAAVRDLLYTGAHGIYHLVNEGACSRWAFAQEILRLAGLGEVRNIPILAREYRRASTPPPYGALHNINGAAQGIRLRPWQEALADYLEQTSLK